MVMRHHVDVVIATGTPAPSKLTIPSGPTETVDVAPDAARRIVVVATTMMRARAIAQARGINRPIIVTPRSPEGARGVTADEIVWDEDLTHEERADLEPQVLPATATTQTQTGAGE